MNTATERSAVVFISGPMSGIADFNRVAQVLADAGMVVLNPAILPDGLNHDQYLALSLKMLAAADVIYQLEGWSASKGARREAVEARLLGLPFFSQSLRAMGECPPRALELPKSKKSVCCSFCLKSCAAPSTDGKRFIAGNGVCICQDCVDICNDIIATEGKK